MKQSNINLKKKEGMKVERIIEIFEQESPMVQTILTLKKYANKLLIIGIIYIFLIIFIQKYHYIASILISLIFSGFMIRAVYKKVGEVSYHYSSTLGGKKSKYIFKKEGGILQTTAYNLVLMQQEEWRLINRCLKANHLNNTYCIKELETYFTNNKSQKKYEIKKFLKDLLSLYIVPITIGIIGIYTSICQDIGLEQNILNISYIILGAIFILLIMIPSYIVYHVKKFSITDNYIYPRIEKLLLEVLLDKEKNKRIKN